MAAWTAAWMVFEWWAVIGWPDALERSPATLMLGGVATLVGVVVWRDVRESPTPADLPRADLPRAVKARVIPLRRVRTASVAVEDAEDPDFKDVA